jgi:hypothetical protein
VCVPFSARTAFTLAVAMISARSAAGSFGSFGMKTAPTRMTASAAAIAKAVISLTSITRSPRTTPAARSARSRPSEYSSRPSPDMASPVSVYSATASGSFVLALAMLIAVSRNRSHPTGSSSGVVLFSVFTLIFQVWRKVRLRTGATLVGLQPQPFRQLAGRPCDRASLSCASRTQFSRAAPIAAKCRPEHRLNAGRWIQKCSCHI